MAKKIEKTNAARLLDKARIAYNLIPYEFDENDLAAQHVADSLGQDISRVFKTLVLIGDKTGHIVCVVPGNMEVDLKALAKASGNKKVQIPTVFTSAPAVIKEFEKTPYAARLKATGVILSYICPLMYMNNPLCKSMPVMTSSNKLRTYTTARYYTEAEILTKITKGV
jgi:predicted aconitase